ncbi:hypothetical protein BLLJ_0999 [Bifidobacterium longum subsp. longum JCM 1217]|uniref:Colicin transporter n=1 Tax=Bifidobacterium longum TaxID=216816 RepID=A0AA45V8V1_BIFLN|nr:hypothetical protein [Bifidobacterium longum]EPE38878.1 hypothetical protein I118_1147 [Bifidobacterium longum D2957]KFI63692.1 hypothetical protein BLSL_0989 [Bifidobacterium longum subsp. longum]MBX9025723.1 hypothetical protein [Bifidobacterium longum]MDQ4445347.1 hypothetical protein [Bifidobacterium longum]MEC3825177.1 hypothetical protein [Bifidobacterium longum]
MSGSNPVPQPPTEPSGAARAASKPKRPKWLVPVIAGGCAVVLAAGGIGGCLYWNHDRLTAASEECATSYDRAVKARKKLTEYLKSDALQTAIRVKDSEVRDAKTVGTLASTVKTASKTKTDIPGCPADGLKDIKAVTAWLDKTADVYAKTVGEVKAEAEAVNASKLDKIVADATRILNDSKGRVKDDKVRAALENAIKSKDGKAISDAVKAVNDSIKAKSDADANARAEKEKQAADNAAQAQTDNSGSYTGDTTGGYTGYTGGGYTQSQGGYAYMPQQSTGGSTGGGYTPTPQPQPAPPPSQGGGGDDGYEDICWAVDTSGKPGVQVPCN